MTELTFQQFGRKLQASATHLENSEAQIVRVGTAALASEVAGAYRRATGGDGKLSGTSGARRKSGKESAVSAKAKDVRRYGGNYVGLVVPTGPFGLIERDIEPHTIAPFSFSARTRRSTVRKAVKAARAGDRSAVAAARLARAGLDARQSANLLIGGRHAGFYKSVNHPGSRGRRVFSRAVASDGKRVVDGMLKESTKQLVAGYKAGR